MSKISLEGNASGTGTFSIAAPNSNTNYTITLPQENGTLFTTGATTGLSGSAISTGTVAVAYGGTGANTLASNNVLLGNGTSALQTVAPGASGNVLTSNGTTWQSIAPAAGYVGPSGQVFTSSGTFTVPAGITKLKVTVVAGGGGGRGATGNGGTGGQSSFGSAAVANGGGGGVLGGSSLSTTSGGTATAGTILINGGPSGSSPSGFGSGGASAGGAGAPGNGFASGCLSYSDYGAPARGFLGSSGYILPGGGGLVNATGYGNGGTTFGGNQYALSGGGGGMAIAYLTGQTPGANITVTVGSGGSAGGGSPSGGAGTPGIVIVEW